MYIKLEDFSNNEKYARYSPFGIGDENEGYRLSFIGEYTGTAGKKNIIHVALISFYRRVGLENHNFFETIKIKIGRCA